MAGISWPELRWWAWRGDDPAKICAALAERGHLTSGGKPYGPNAIMKMLASD
jgi:hypothetical protein